MGLPVQDGGVEGYGLISSCETTKITTSCWTTIDRRKTGEPAKKYTPHSEIKKKLQDGRRGENMIKLNPLTAGWAIYNPENNNTKGVLSLLKVLSLMSGFPVWGSGKKTRNHQGIWLWRPVGFDYTTSIRLVHILLKTGFKDFEHYLASMWSDSICMVVWTSFGIAFP